MAELHELTARDRVGAIRGREVAPTEALAPSRVRMAALDGQVGAFVTPTPELAAEQARAAEQTLAASDESDLPALLGVPLPIKDLTMVAGVPMNAGSAASQGVVSEAVEGVVHRISSDG